MYVKALKMLLRLETNLTHLNKQSSNNFLFIAMATNREKVTPLISKKSCKLIFWATSKRYLDLLVNNFVYKYLYTSCFQVHYNFGPKDYSQRMLFARAGRALTSTFVFCSFEGSITIHV